MKNQTDMRDLKRALLQKGVLMPDPAAVQVYDIDVERIEAGVVLHPGVRVEGNETLLMRGTELGAVAGGRFRNVRCGRDVILYGGEFNDCVFLHNVTLRGQAEVRGGTLLEEGCEGAHHVGYKMTIMLPYVIAGSLVNFCDALVSGGTGRKDHSEIGSTLALYNFTPWGDKFASLFGGVPRGVFLRSRRVFIGGQTQIISPVHVGFGAVIAAGMAVRRDVPENTLYGEVPVALNQQFDPVVMGAVSPKVVSTVRYIGHLRALDAWYKYVRLPTSTGLEHELFVAGRAQVTAGIAERIKRLDKFIAKLPASLEKRARFPTADSNTRRIIEHREWITGWPDVKSALESGGSPEQQPLVEIAEAIRELRQQGEDELEFLSAVQSLPDALVESGVDALEQVVVATMERSKLSTVGERTIPAR